MPSALVLGPQGVTGSAITSRLAQQRAWELTTSSRRELEATHRHVAVDLLDADAVRHAFADLGDVSYLVHAAYVERATMAQTVGPNVAMLAHALDGLAAAGAELRRIVLIGGGKSYGEHLGAYKTPAKENDPPVLAPILYTAQEDLLRGRAGVEWTVLRPDLVIGPSLGSPMNLLTALGVYATLSKDAGAPLRFPGAAGAWTALHQITDARLLASAVEWALTSPAAAGEIFNVTNGDLFRWQHLWPEIAEVFEMPAGQPLPMVLADELDGYSTAWDRLRESHGLAALPFNQVAGWAFADAVWSSEFDMVQSTVKIRQAGFHDVIDSHESITGQLAQLRTSGLLP